MYEKLIAACNNYLAIVYPAGNLIHGSEQHRDLVRTFFAGVFETLIVLDLKDKGRELFPRYREMGLATGK